MTEPSATTFYESEYHGRHHAALIENADYWTARAELARAYYFADTAGLRVFDFGCGQGQSIGLLQHAAGWDVSSEARRVARERGVTVHDSMETVEAAAWDVVFCRHVLEHVEEPLATLRSLRRLVAPGGHLFLILPREEHYLPGMAPDINQHLHCWNFRAIFNLLHRAGYEPFEASTHFPFGWKALLPVRKRFGFGFYYTLTRWGEALRRNGEIWIRARRVEG